VAEILWRRHIERMTAAKGQLKARLASPGMARHEPWGIRASVLLLLTVALATGWQDAPQRLLRAISPDMIAKGPSIVAEVWVTPPDHTHTPPIYLAFPPSSPAAVEPLALPAGSRVLARVEGVRRPPELRIGDTAVAFVPVNPADHSGVSRAETSVGNGDAIQVLAGRHAIAEWPIRIVADAAPVVRLTAPPTASETGLVTFDYQATDDYGVVEVNALVRARSEDGSADGDERRIPVAKYPSGLANANGRAAIDLAADPLAGRAVTLQLSATDGAGQTGSSEVDELVLPQRRFSHPVAQALIAARQRLAEPGGEVRRTVAASLDALGRAPQTFNSDLVVGLAIIVSKARLTLQSARDQVETVRALLWDTALRLDEGAVPSSEQRLRNAQQQLMEALAADATQNQIERLMEEVEQALRDYLAAVGNELERRSERSLPGAMPPLQTLTAHNLTDLIEMMRQQLRAGSRDGARALLGELQRIVDGIRQGMRSGDPKALAEAQQLYAGLSELASQQQALLDETYRLLQVRPESGKGGRGGTTEDKAAARRQQQLRQKLTDLTKRLEQFLGKAPRPLSHADRAMGAAVPALENGRLALAVPAQTQAVDELNKAMEAATQAMAQRLGSVMGLGPGVPGGDFFGRERQDGRSGLATGTLSIPDRAELQRVQELVEELRRRAGEYRRPQPELDYIQRLLRQF
jgi:uncharacterized protein (TIGR02302 family)